MQTTFTPPYRAPDALLGMLRQRWRTGIACPSDWLFALSVSLCWLLFYNVRFWQDTAHAMWHGTPGSAAFLGSLFVLVLCLQAILLLLLPSRRLMLVGASLGFIVAAVSSHFSLKFGVVMNKDMLRNVFETDVAEAHSLVTVDLIERVVIMGLLPALAVWKVRLPLAVRWFQRLRQHAIAISILLVACGIALVSTSASYAVFFREHKPIRFALMPAAPVTSTIWLAFQKNEHDRGPLINAGGVAHRTAPPSAKPLLVIMVVGETARAADFQLGGYARDTNPELTGANGLVYFPNATSCDTSTATSVPCMFSHFDRKTFDVDEASRYANVLDALHEAGLEVEWHDNNAGCKGVCDRVAKVDYSQRHGQPLCQNSYCFDEIMLEDVAAKLHNLHRDTVLVLHQIGSHGPAYSERYPPEFEHYRPACRSNQLQQCSAQEVVNAYDNTIRYTDHVLARAIELLRAASSEVDSVLLYASDHGESLGEQGLYLHGLPYRFAPETQTHIPMLLWVSSGYSAREGVAPECLQSRASAKVSHDNLYHTLLGAAEVRNRSYDSQLDLLAACRTRLPIDHE